MLIDVGRDPIEEEDALIEALKEEKRRGAAVNAFILEPLPEEQRAICGT